MSETSVLVGVDGSPASLAAATLAAREAAVRGCPLRILYADPWNAGHDALHDAASRADAVGVSTILEEVAGDPATALLAAADKAELVVVGHRGRGGFPELLLGSVAAKVAAHAHVPVLVTRGEPASRGPVAASAPSATASCTTPPARSP